MSDDYTMEELEDAIAKNALRPVDIELLELKRQGWTARQIAGKYRISKGYVYSLLAHARGCIRNRDQWYIELDSHSIVVLHNMGVRSKEEAMELYADGSLRREAKPGGGSHWMGRVTYWRICYWLGVEP